MQENGEKVAVFAVRRAECHIYYACEEKMTDNLAVGGGLAQILRGFSSKKIATTK